jgi:glycosyltransferase involved in cell wall biosynthesis
MKNPLVSIIIPYYNGAKYVYETINSAISQTYTNIEIILIDDGSTDPDSINLFNLIDHNLLKKYRTNNQGLSTARNTAISLANGEIILPLDCDDLISNTYVEKAVNEFEKNSNLGIVYAHAKFFGDVNHYWDLPEFNMIDFLVNNCIFCSGLFKKSDWKAAGGYKVDMIYGLEDYDFWLSIISMKKEVLRLPDIHFFYRKHGSSMISNLTPEKLSYSYSKIFSRHHDLYHENLIFLLSKINYLSSQLHILSK